MIVYFLRHGLAGDRADWHTDDALRPLTQQGITKMAKEADSIYGLNLGLDLILTSPFTRAFQTARIVAERLDMLSNFIQDDRLVPGFNLSALAKILDAYPTAENILLVGHEPDFSSTVSDLIGGGRLLLKKGGLVRVDMISRSPLQGELTWLVPPKLLAG